MKKGVCKDLYPLYAFYKAYDSVQDYQNLVIILLMLLLSLSLIDFLSYHAFLQFRLSGELCFLLENINLADSKEGFLNMARHRELCHAILDIALYSIIPGGSLKLEYLDHTNN